MKLSIITPVYNTADYLPNCLDSLLAQDLEDCELLLVDDGSTDGRSGPLCDAYASRRPEQIRVIHKENGGLGDARNAGLAQARGEYVLFIDSDDYVSERLLPVLRSYLELDPDVLVFRFAIDRAGAVEPAPPDDLPFGRIVCLADAPTLLLAAPNAWNKLWRRSLFTENDIRFPPRLWYEDMATTAKLYAKAEKILAIPDALYFYVQREGSITHNRNAERNLEIISAVRMILDWYRAEGLYESYQKEFEALTICNVLQDASVRVLKMGTEGEDAPSAEQRRLLDKLRDFACGEYPNWPENPYLKRLPFKRRLILSLLSRRRYRAVRQVFRLKERWRGAKTI